MEPALRTVLLGNSFASRAQLPALRWAGGSEVIGIAGHDAQKARRTAAEWKIPHGGGDWRAALALEPELVIVTTPVDLHREMTLAALDTGAAVLCEKPFALNVAEAEEMLQSAAGRRAAGGGASRPGDGWGAWIDHELRWNPSVRRLRSLVREGFLGEPWHVMVQMHYGSAAFRRRPFSWWFQSERGGGVLGALGSHLIDLVRFVFDGVAIEAVRCDLATHVPERADARGVRHRVTADEHARVDLRLASGALVEIGTSLVLQREPLFELLLTGSAGLLRLIDAEHLSAARLGGEEESLAVEPRLPTNAELGMPEVGFFGRCLPLFLRDLVHAVRTGSALPEAADFADGLAVQEVLDAAHRSNAEGGGWVELR